MRRPGRARTFNLRCNVHIVRPSRLLATLATLTLLAAGCVQNPPGNDSTLPPPDVGAVLDEVMTFAAHVVDPAVHAAVGLYEPTIDVSASGIIYISAHTIGVDTTGAPAFFSNDGGKTWKQLPFLATASIPEPVHGGTPPPSDEIFIVAGDDGQAWGVDITLTTYPVNGWCKEGAEHCYHNPNAYNRADTEPDCADRALNDRPWAAYANGTLLMVNNPGGGPVQVGAMKVPRSTYVEVANPVQGPTWNLCAGSGGSIPGIPDMRGDLFFAVPQMQGEGLALITGRASNVKDVQETKVFKNSHEYVSEIGNYGQAAFDADGTLFVSAMNNKAGTAKKDAGGIHVAVSQDDAASFVDATFRFPQPVSSLYIDGNKWGPGALINWGQIDGDATDWYMGHLFVGATGLPEIHNISLAVDNGPAASRHVQGAALGPDGRGYMVMSDVSGNDEAQSVMQTGKTPLRVVVQETGPRLPVVIPAAVAGTP